MSSSPAVEPLLRLRPLGLGEIVDDVFRVYRRHFWMIVGIALILALPGLLVQIVSGSAVSIGFLMGLLPELGSPGALVGPTSPIVTPWLDVRVAWLTSSVSVTPAS